MCEIAEDDESWPERAEAVQALAAEPLPVAELRLARAHVVGAGVAPSSITSIALASGTREAVSPITTG